MSILDSGPGSLTAMATVIVFVVRLAVAVAQRWRATQDRAMSDVPPSPQLGPPKTDPTILARLDRMDAANALSVALHHARADVDERDRRIRELEQERADLATQLKIERAGRAIANDLLRAKDEAIVRLQEDLARARTRARGEVVEVSRAEYRDASEAGPIQDALATPLRPPRS